MPICSMCRIGEHDGCAAQGTHICLCPECWVDEESTEDEDD